VSWQKYRQVNEAAFPGQTGGYAPYLRLRAA